MNNLLLDFGVINSISKNKEELYNNYFLNIPNGLKENLEYNKKFYLGKIENNFFEYNRFLEHFNAENLESFGNNFFSQNWRIDSVTFPKLQQIGDNYFNCNLSMKYRIDEIINENTNGKEK